MKFAPVLATCMIVSACVTASAAADRFPAAQAIGGGAPRIVTEHDTGAQLAGVQIFLPAGLERQTLKNAGVASFVAESILRTPVSSGGVTLPLVDQIADASGSISYALDARNAHFYIEGYPKDIAGFVALLGQAFAHPDFSAQTIARARTALDARSADAEGSPFFVGTQMARRGFYLGGLGSPAFGTAATLDALKTSDLSAFFAANYRRDGLSVSGAGETVAALGDAVAALSQTLPAGAPPAADHRVVAFGSTVKRIVARRDIGAPLTVLGFAAPEPSSKDLGPMLVVQAMLSTIFETSNGTSPTLPERPVQSVYQYDAAPASFVVIINGGRIDRTLGISEVVLVTHSLASKKLDDKTLVRLKAAARGWVTSSTLTLNDRSYMIGTLVDRGVGSDALNVALDAIDRTTAADIQRIASRYLQKFVVAEVLPREPGAPQSKN